MGLFRPVHFFYGALAKRAVPAFARLSQSEQRAVLRTSRQSVGAIASLSVAAAFAAWQFGTIWLIKANWPTIALCLVACGTWFIAGFVIVLYTSLRVQLPWIRRAVAERLSGTQQPVCANCGYDLRGNRTSRCPECGAAFESQHVEARR